jgi:hypothetical protein
LLTKEPAVAAVRKIQIEKSYMAFPDVSRTKESAEGQPEAAGNSAVFRAKAWLPIFRSDVTLGDSDPRTPTSLVTLQHSPGSSSLPKSKWI